MHPRRQTILFQGDSITDGNRNRNEDPHILGHGYAFTIVSKLGFELAPYRPHFINRGVSGNRHLLSETKEMLPSAGLVLCEPFILKVGLTDEKWEEWRKRIDDCRRIVRQLAEDYDAILVPLQEAFNKASSGMDAAYWIWDGVHPTAVGHELIAREWLSIVQNSPLAIR